MLFTDDHAAHSLTDPTQASGEDSCTTIKPPEVEKRGMRYGVFTMQLNVALKGCLLEQTTAIKVTECAMKCVTQQECKSAVYAVKTGYCALHNCKADEALAQAEKREETVYCELTNQK